MSEAQTRDQRLYRLSLQQERVAHAVELLRQAQLHLHNFRSHDVPYPLILSAEYLLYGRLDQIWEAQQGAERLRVVENEHHGT